LGPEDIERLVAAYHETWRTLDLKNRDDPMTRMIAKKDNRGRSNWHSRSGADFPA
jgi:hypothetical protein